MFCRCLCSIIFASVWVSSIGHCAVAADTASDLQSKLARLNNWLDTGSKAEGWRRYLRLNVLETQAAKGNLADIATLQQIYNRFASKAPGLDRPAFAMVRDSIQQHIRQLEASRFPNLDNDIFAAQFQFRPILPAQFDQLKNAAILDTQMLKSYMKKTLSSRERALAFYELRPDELVAYLRALQVELPPTRSLEVLSAETKALQDRAKQIVERIDQLNEQIKKINQWMQDVDQLKGDEAAPPMPDNEDQDEEPKSDKAPEGDDSTTSSTTPPDQDIEPDRKPILEMETRNLMDELERIKAQIKRLQQESDQIKKSETERNQRRSKVLNELRERTAGFDKLDGTYNDAFFAAAQDSVQRVVRGYFYASDSGLSNDFQSRIRILLENYHKLSDPSQRRAAAEVGAALGWMESAMQIPQWTTAIRAKHSLPNLEVSVSGVFLNRIASQDVNQVQRVNELILGRLIRGRAQVNGNVNVELVDDPNQLHASLRLFGMVNSDTYTRSGPITAYAGSNAQIEARRSIFANVGGFYASSVYGAANLGSYLKGVDSGLRLVQRIAQKQYLKDKQLAESISAARLENRMIPAFQIQTDDALDNGKTQFQKLQQQQDDQAKMIPNLYLFSWQNRLHVVGQKTSLFDLAAPQRASAESFVNPDIQVKLHESMLSNYASPLLAGRTFTNEELAQRLSQLVGELPKADPNEESYQISFDTVRPIQFEFFDSTIGATITGRRFKQGRNTIPAPLMIKIQYRVHRGVDGKLYLRRAGNVVVDYVEPEKKNAKTVAFKTFLEDRLNKVTQDEKLMNIQLPPNLIPVDEVESLKDRPVLHQLSLVQLRVENGWLYAGWDHNPGPWVGPHVIDTPAILSDVPGHPMAHRRPIGIGATGTNAAIKPASGKTRLPIEHPVV